MQIKIAFLSSISYACLNVWNCVATFFSWLYVLLLCYHAFAILVVVKNKKNEWMQPAPQLIAKIKPVVWRSLDSEIIPAQRHGGHSGAVPSPNDCSSSPPKKLGTPSGEVCAPKKLTGSGLLECKSRPKTRKIVLIALEFVGIRGVFKGGIRPWSPFWVARII